MSIRQKRIDVPRAAFAVYGGPAAATAAEAVESVNRAFEEFKATHEQKLAELAKGFDDVVTTEKLESLNATITALQAQVNEFNLVMARMNIGGAGNDDDPARAAHAEAFNKWFRRGIDDGLRDLEVQAALTTQSDPDGGFLVPTEMEATIDRVLGTVSALRGLATVRPIGAASYTKLMNKGGNASGWVAEQQSRPATTTPQLVALEFPAMEIYSSPVSTQTALDDASMDLAAWLGDEVSINFAEDEGNAFVLGSGVGMPRGILSYDTVANASYTWGNVGHVVSGAAADFASSDPSDAFIDLIHALKKGYRQNASWLMNDMTVATVRKFKDGQGNYLWQPSAQAGQPERLLGYPLETDDNMPDVAANALAVAFADFRRGYLIVDRRGIRVLRDPFTSKPNVLFYTTKRVGGGIQNFEAIKLMKIST